MLRSSKERNPAGPYPQDDQAMAALRLQALPRCLLRRIISTRPNTIKPPIEASALAQPPLEGRLKLTTMNPLSWLVVQRSPEAMPRSFGKLGFEVAQSKLLVNVGSLELAY